MAARRDPWAAAVLARDESWCIADTQHGFVTAQQALEAGVSYLLRQAIERGYMQGHLKTTQKGRVGGFT